MYNIEDNLDEVLCCFLEYFCSRKFLRQGEVMVGLVYNKII